MSMEALMLTTAAIVGVIGVIFVIAGLISVFKDHGEKDFDEW